jgi:hypothetical protein
MISTTNISNALRKLSSADGVTYFAPAFELLDKLPESCDVATVSRTICGELEDEMAAELLSVFLVVEDEEGEELTHGEAEDSSVLFYDICERFPVIMELAQGG